MPIYLSRLLAVIFSAICSPILLHAQSAPCYVYAKVVDAQTLEPLEGVSFKLDGTDTGLFTDTAGLVRLLVTCEEHTLRFFRLGFKPFSRRVTITGDELYAVEMENISTQMEEVVITSQGNVRTLETPALGVSVLSMKAVKKITPAAGEVDILRGLQSLPGISSVGEGANGINIRGGAVDQNLILLDNMPIYNPTHLLGLFSLFPNDAIREMQVYKGSVPARYGGRTAGVLDVKLNEPSLDSRKLLGGIGLISNRLHLETPLIKDKLSWMTSARFSYTDYLIQFYNKAFVGTFSDNRIPNVNPIFYDFANKLVWRPTARDHISITSYNSYDRYNIDNLFSIAGITPRLATMKYGHRSIAARWNHFFSERFNLNTVLARTDYFTSTSATELQAGFDYDTRLFNHNAKVEATWIPSEKHRINTGIGIVRYDNRPAQLIPQSGSLVQSAFLQKEQAWETALFFSDEYAIHERLLVDIGGRLVQYWNMGAYTMPIFDPEQPRSVTSVLSNLEIGKGRYESQFLRFEPRLAIRYKIGDLASIKMGYNRMNQFLQMIANTSTPLPNVRWKTANRYIKPTQSDLVSIGYFRDTKNRHWEWSVESYFRNQTDIFDYVNGADLNINPLVETQLLKGAARAYGAELFVNKKKGLMTGWMSYTYARSLQKITGDYPAIQQLNRSNWFASNIDKPHTLNVLISFQAEKHNSASFTFTYSTGRPYTAPVGFFRGDYDIVPIFIDRNNARIADYHRLDFSWTITNPTMKKQKVESSWVVTFYNIYGRKNAFSYFFDPKLSTFKPFKVSVFPTPIFSITWNFEI